MFNSSRPQRETSAQTSAQSPNQRKIFQWKTNTQDRNWAEFPGGSRVKEEQKRCIIPPQQHWSPPSTRWCCDASRRAQWCFRGDPVDLVTSASCWFHPPTPGPHHRPLTALRTTGKMLVRKWSHLCFLSILRFSSSNLWTKQTTIFWYAGQTAFCCLFSR